MTFISVIKWPMHAKYYISILTDIQLKITQQRKY